MSDTFKALVLEEVEGKSRASFKELASTDLPLGSNCQPLSGTHAAQGGKAMMGVVF